MSRFIIIQETGSDQVLVVDKQSKTVEQIDASLLDDFEDGPDAASGPIMRGISAAIASSQRLHLSGRVYFSA
jgi:hypothetical protein